MHQGGGWEAERASKSNHFPHCLSPKCTKASLFVCNNVFWVAQKYYRFMHLHMHILGLAVEENLLTLTQGVGGRERVSKCVRPPLPGAKWLCHTSRWEAGTKLVHQVFSFLLTTEIIFVHSTLIMVSAHSSSGSHSHEFCNVGLLFTWPLIFSKMLFRLYLVLLMFWCLFFLSVPQKVVPQSAEPSSFSASYYLINFRSVFAVHDVPIQLFVQFSETCS